MDSLPLYAALIIIIFITTIIAPPPLASTDAPGVDGFYAGSVCEKHFSFNMEDVKGSVFLEHELQKHKLALIR